MNSLELVSHVLCPYVQRVAISLSEKSVPFERIYIDLGNKPDWFRMLSPLGKVPLLKTEHGTIFESVAILEYLEDVYPESLHPRDPFHRARHRAWMEFGSNILNDIAGLYGAKEETTFLQKCRVLREKFEQVEAELKGETYFDGESFGLVDVVFGPIFRYWDVFDELGEFGILKNLPKTAAWRAALTARPSVRDAVLPTYSATLGEFLRSKQSFISHGFEVSS
jgi:glutathione S-transferase